MVVGSPGDHWLTDHQYLKIARETVDGTFGYAIDYKVPDCGELTLFWPRSQIHLNGNKSAPRWRRSTHRCESGRLYYPSHITARSLPRVHAGILRLEKAYRAEARGGIAAASAFAVVVGSIEAAPALVAVASRALVIRSSSQGVSVVATARKAAAPKVPAAAADDVPEVSRIVLRRRRPTVAPMSRAARRANGSRRGRLERNLIAAGFKKGPGEVAHHIVPAGAKRAKRARRVLERFKISLDDADNGVFLPATSRSPNPARRAVHSRVHTKDYYQKVNDLLGTARNAEHARQLLHELAEKLLAGGL